MFVLGLKHVLLLGAVARVVMIFYVLVKYTDVDYDVFSDAARFVWQGRSPYERLTAWALVPNEIIHSVWGKVLFVAADMVIGYLIFSILSHMNHTRAVSILASAAWLFNPIAINVSTRGNADSLVGLCVVAALYCIIVKNNLTLAAVLYVRRHLALTGNFLSYGLSVHLKIYPIIYSITRYKYVRTFILHLHFAVLTSAMFALYGFPFLDEAYLYHVRRSDPRHNFSLYFYHLYLSQSGTSKLTALLAFLPQVAVLALGLRFNSRQTIFFGLFSQTFAFVLFNKYFVWYLVLLPLCLPVLRLSLRTAAVLLVTWLGVQALWLQSAYDLEFLGKQAFARVWMASVLFFVANTWILIRLTRQCIASSTPRSE